VPPGSQHFLPCQYKKCRNAAKSRRPSEAGVEDDDLGIRISVANRVHEAATLHVLPTLLVPQYLVMGRKRTNPIPAAPQMEGASVISAIILNRPPIREMRGVSGWFDCACCASLLSITMKCH